MRKWLAFLALFASPVGAQENITDLISPEGRELIIRWEVSSPTVYTRKYLWPICPLCESTVSGVTIGIGYDLGHSPINAVRSDWQEHQNLADLEQVVGLKGKTAKERMLYVSHVITKYPYALLVFDRATIPKYYRIAVRTFGQPYTRAPPKVRGALLSVVYNRGGSLGTAKNREKDLPRGQRDSRWEIRQIANDCLPRQDYVCVEYMIREMSRLWPSTKGLRDRREDEAKLVGEAR